jgi:hypothetical protein
MTDEQRYRDDSFINSYGSPDAVPKHPLAEAAVYYYVICTLTFPHESYQSLCQ